jgi:hypothetical protein
MLPIVAKKAVVAVMLLLTVLTASLAARQRSRERVGNVGKR